MTRSKVKVKVTGLLKFRKLHFSKSISSAIYTGAGNDHLILNLQHNIYICSVGFLLFVLVFVPLDLELGGVPAVSPSTIFFSGFYEIWCADSCRWLMHDGMPYDPSKVKVKVTSAWKPLKRSRPSVPHWTKFYLTLTFLKVTSYF